jgi:hypothetical protein
MTGTIVAVKGMLSINAEKIADAHIISAIEKYLFFKRKMPGKWPCTRKERRMLTYADVARTGSATTAKCLCVRVCVYMTVPWQILSGDIESICPYRDYLPIYPLCPLHK